MAQPTPQLAVDTMTGDIRDFLLTWIRSMQKPFQQMAEKDQKNVISAAEDAARNLVGAVIGQISSNGFEKAFVKVVQFTVKGGIEAKISADCSDHNLLNFSRFSTRSAIMVFADPAEFDGQVSPAQLWADQRDIEDVLKEPAEEPHDPETGEVTGDRPWVPPAPATPGFEAKPIDEPFEDGGTDPITENQSPATQPTPLVRPSEKAKRGYTKKVKNPAPGNGQLKGLDADPGEPAEVTINDSAPVVTRTSERDPFAGNDDE